MKERLINELLNKEMTLLELDNKVKEITSSKDSIFAHENMDCIYYENLSYYIDEIEDYINIEWITIESSEKCNFEIIVKVTEIY